MSEQSKAPEVIWAYDDGLNSPDSKTWGNSFYIGTEYVSRDHCNALVAAAYERAAQHHDRHAEYYKAPCQAADKTAHQEHAKRIRSLTPADAQAAYDAALSAARAEGYAKALEAVSDEWSMAIQGDLEHGVQTLNVNAANAFAKNYPNLSSFGDWLDGQIERAENGND